MENSAAPPAGKEAQDDAEVVDVAKKKKGEREEERKRKSEREREREIGWWVVEPQKTNKETLMRERPRKYSSRCLLTREI